MELCYLHPHAGSSEPALASTVAERVLERVVERGLKKQRLTLTSLTNVGDKLLSEPTPHSAWFDNTLAGKSFNFIGCKRHVYPFQAIRTTASKVYKKLL